MSFDKSLKKVARPKKVVWTLEPGILLCPNVPQPMHGTAPRAILGQKWWDETRKAAYASTAYHCKACGVHKFDAKSKQWMEGHELYIVDYAKGLMTYVSTVPLCHYCHNYIHDGRLNALAEKGQIRKSSMVAILQHGDSVLASAGLHRPPHRERERAIIDLLLEGKVAPWKKWRLVIDGKKYPPKFKSPEQWRAAFK